MTEKLTKFIQDCNEIIHAHNRPTDYVFHIAPLMCLLLENSPNFLKEEHFSECESHYQRNRIYIDPARKLSLYALVWKPGQWTPIHDHGTWGVVGVFKGHLYEKNFIRTDSEIKSSRENIQLTSGGTTILTKGAVTSFVPNPDHIHITGNPTSKTSVSLHLYGNAMAGFNIYDREKRTKVWNEVSHT